MREYALVEGFTSEVQFGEPIWLEAIAAREYHTPNYGKVPVSVDTLQNMVKGFKEGIRGQEIATNYDHGTDVAKGSKASGWFRDFDIRPSSDGQGMSLFTKVEFTEEAQKEIEKGEWKYFSLEWDDWMDNTGVVHKDVIVGGAITNRPVAKHMQALPINFSETQWRELDEETKKEFAVWSTAFVDTLPDSAFLFVEPGGTKDSEGKTVPRTNRHFPFKGNDGKVDLPHLRNAIARIPQAGKWLSENTKQNLQAKAKAMLSAATKKMAETAAGDADDAGVAQIIKELEALLPKAEASDRPKIQRAMTLLQGMEINMSELVDIVGEVFDETKEWEHSEPGTGTPPTPRQDEDGSDDPAIGGGWRRNPLPLDPNDPDAPHSEGSKVLTDEQFKELLTKLGLTESATPEQVIEVAGKSFSEAKSLRDALSNVDEEKKFAETYPTMFAEMGRLKKVANEGNAKQFSESVSVVTRQEGEKQVSTGSGLSTLAKEKVENLHLKFAEGSATLADFEDVMQTVTHGGLVKFGEDGSGVPAPLPVETNTQTVEGIQDARYKFAELLNTVKVDPAFADKSLGEQMREAAKRDPELAKAYRATAAA